MEKTLFTMIQYTNVLQKQYHLSPKITMCVFFFFFFFFVKILLKMTPALGTGLELGTFAVCKIVYIMIYEYA